VDRKAQTRDGRVSGRQMSEREPGNTMRERVGDRTTRAKLFVLLDVDRLTLAAGLTVALFVAFVVVGLLDGSPLRAVLRNADSLETLFNALVGALITGVTVVVTISQLVLSQETGPLGDQRERMEGAVEFRRDAESVLGATPPPEPASFLRALVDVSRERGERLRDAVDGTEPGEENGGTDGSGETDGTEGVDDELADRVDQFVDGLVENAEAVTDQLEGAQFGRYEVLRAALDYNYSWKIYQLRRLRNDYADALTDDAEAAVSDVERVLELFGPAREHVKTLYFQWALVDLTRSILYATIPALGVAVVVLLFLDASSFPGATLGVDNVLLLAAASTAFALFPFVLLAAYMFRLATIAKRTLAIGPFILRESSRSDEIDWE